MSIHWDWLICPSSVSKLRFPLHSYFPCILFTEETRSFALQFPQSPERIQFNFLAGNKRRLSTASCPAAPRTPYFGNTELPVSLAHTSVPLPWLLFPSNILLAQSSLDTADSVQITPAPQLSHTYPPQLAPLVPRCMRGSLEASLISSFHSFCHSSSVYTKPDCVKDRWGGGASN